MLAGTLCSFRPDRRGLKNGAKARHSCARARHFRFRAISGAALALLLGACATTGDAPEPLLVRGLEFENRSRTAVTSIQLLVPATGNFVSCGRIAPGARCAARFPEVSYAGHPIEVKWIQGGAEWTTGATPLNISSEARAAGAGEVRVVVISPGSAGVVLVPSRGGGVIRNP